MKSPKYILAVFALTLCIAEGIKAATFFPVGKPEHEFVYDYARRDEIKGGFYYYNYNVAPFNFDEAGISGSLFSLADGVNQDNFRTFAFLTEDFRSAKYSRAEGFESLRGGMVAKPVRNLFIYGNFLVDERLADDPEYTGKKWHGAAGEVEEAFAAYGGRNFDIILGRFASFWGPAYQSLILSGEARPMDAFSFRFKWGRIRFAYQFGKLQRLAVSTDTTEYFENRYFAGHRIDFRLFDNFNIGLFETIVFGGKGRHPELSYMNPLLIYHAVQLNEDVDDNTLLGLDMTYYINNRHKLYGQLLIDDYQIDDDTPGDEEPNEIGFLAGVHSLDFLGLCDVEAEYLRIANRTYNQQLPRNRYENRGELIGHGFGSDGDRLSLSFVKWYQLSHRATLSLTYERKGEGRYDDEWTSPWDDAEGDYSEPFPTGIVEKTLKTDVRLTGFFKRLIFYDLRAGVEDVSDFDHVADDDRTVPFFSLRISLILSGLLSIN